MAIIKYKSGNSWIEIPTIKGSQGDVGNGISSAVLNDDYTLTLTFTNGQIYTTPSLRGQIGPTPVITSTKSGKITTILCDGSPVATIADGEDGHSPIITTSKSGKVTTIYADGASIGTVLDGADAVLPDFLHICTSGEYDTTTRVPTIQNPSANTLYLVPNENAESGDLFSEWVYVNNAWELTGSAKIDLSGFAHKVDDATEGNFATLDANGDLIDSGKSASDFNKITITDPNSDGNLIITALINWHPKSEWEEYVDIVRSGEAKSHWQVGDEILSTLTYEDPNTKEPITLNNPWIVVGFEDGVELENGDTFDNVPVLQMKYLFSRVSYSEQDEVPATEEYALDGYYYFAYENHAYSDGVQLNLNTGDPIPYSEHNHIIKSIWNSIGPIVMGINDWGYSLARQYLNNTGEIWATSQYDTNSRPYDEFYINPNSWDPFKYNLPEEMVSALHPTKVITARPAYVGGGTVTTYDTFYLLSMIEMNITRTDGAPLEGTPLDYYKDANNPKVRYWIDSQIKENSWPQSYFTRSPMPDNIGIWLITSNGPTPAEPSTGYSFLPACRLI